MTNKFLNKLKKEEKLGLVEPSEDICDSYSEKSANCLKSAKLLLQNNLYENSIGQSYYAMYNQLLALLFRVGIKCENHGGSILLLKLLFGEDELYKLISDAKKERTEKQRIRKYTQMTLKLQKIISYYSAEQAIRETVLVRKIIGAFRSENFKYTIGFNTKIGSR